MYKEQPPYFNGKKYYMIKTSNKECMLYHKIFPHLQETIKFSGEKIIMHSLLLDEKPEKTILMLAGLTEGIEINYI